jgi:hypothetical protein
VAREQVCRQPVGVWPAVGSHVAGVDDEGRLFGHGVDDLDQALDTGIRRHAIAPIIARRADVRIGKMDKTERLHSLGDLL